MPYDKPLKMQWIEVDGRSVPLVLPQYWSEEQDDWVVSSKQNRLPVDAQLTGSIPEEWRGGVIYSIMGQEVAVGATFFTDRLDFRNYSNMSVFVRSKFAYDVIVRRAPSLSQYPYHDVTLDTNQSANDPTVRIHVTTESNNSTRYSPYLEIGIKNVDTADNTFDLWVVVKQ